MGLELTKAGCEARRRRLWERLGDACDVVVITDPAHLMYFANYHASQFVFRGNEAGAALILERKWDQATLVGDNLLQPFMDEAFVDETVGDVWYQGKTSAPNRRSNFVKILKSSFVAALVHSGQRLGFEPTTFPTALETGPLRTTNVEDAIRAMRVAKDEDELALLRLSIDAIVAGFDAAREHVRPGMSEQEIYRLVAGACQEHVGEPAIVYGDFVTGPRCEAVGGPPSDRILQAGELLLLDLSVVVRGYRGDLATTFAVGGAATARQQELFGVCLEAMAEGEKLLKPGIPCRDVDAAVRGPLRAAGVAQFNNSHAGHGLGLGHPEAPFIVPESTDTLAAGQVVTLEPGVYVPGEGGMRIERNYLITAEGFETLSNHRLEI